MHILSSLETGDANLLLDLEAFRQFIDGLIEKVNVTKLGEAHHKFGGGAGFTLVVLLAESHVAVHTWPEFAKVTLDVYLCNFKHDNTEKCEAVYQGIRNYFHPASENVTRIMR